MLYKIDLKHIHISFQFQEERKKKGTLLAREPEMEIGFCKTQFCRPGMMLRTLETSGRVLEKLDYTRMSGVCEHVD